VVSSRSRSGRITIVLMVPSPQIVDHTGSGAQVDLVDRAVGERPEVRVRAGADRDALGQKPIGRSMVVGNRANPGAARAGAAAEAAGACWAPPSPARRRGSAGSIHPAGITPVRTGWPDDLGGPYVDLT